MNKIEEEFVKEFVVSLGNQKSFEDIKDKIDMGRFHKKKPSSNKVLYRALGLVVAFVFLVAITIPSAIYLSSSSGAPSMGDDPSTGDVGGGSLNENTKVRTAINTFEPSLPHYLAAEVDKRVPIETDEIDINVFLGHPNFRGNVTFPEFVLSQEELTNNYKFVLLFNYNSKSLQVGMDDIDYLHPDYNITMTEQDGMETINFHTVHELTLSKESMLGTDYGFVNAELYLMPLNIQEKYIVTAETLYYSVTDTEIIFGLVQNPVAQDGDLGIISSGWIYAAN